MADDKPFFPPPLRLDLEEWTRSSGDTVAVGRSVPLAVMPGHHLTLQPPSDRLHLDVAPLFDDFVSLVRDAGIPLRAVQDPTGERRIGVSASFNISEGLPAVAFHAGKSVPELFGAFSTAHSFSWALIWPARQFTLRIEGGTHSDFGYFAIAGAEWHHPSRPFAIGVGIPFDLHNANGETGVLLQLRLKFP